MPYQIPGMPMPLDEDENYKKMLTDQLNAPPTPQDPNAGNGQLIASLAGSFNKLGTVGGRTSDMSDVQRYADVLDKSKAARDQTANGQASKRQQILLSLAQLKDKGAQQQNSMQQAMAMNQTKQDFDTKRDAEKFQRDKDLIGLKQSGEKDLALAKLENSPEKAPKPATADERTSALFSARAKDAANLAKQIEDSGYQPSSYGAALRTTDLPVVGMVGANSDDRSYNQAKRSFISAVLRKESGAAISNQEYANEGKKYFPEPGDGPQQIAQKAAERDRAIQTLISASGPAYNPSIQQPFQYKPESGMNDVYAAEPNKNAPSSTGPKVGDVLKGYQFTGGDPADKTNWVKQGSQ